MNEAESSAAVEAPAPATGTETMRTHIVEEGEDLFHVSLMWDVSVDDLKRVNGLTDTKLTPGQQLKIPMPE